MLDSFYGSWAQFWANMKKAQNIPDPRPVKEEGFICYQRRPGSGKGLRLGQEITYFHRWVGGIPKVDKTGGWGGGGRPDPGPLHGGGVQNGQISDHPDPRRVASNCGHV